MTRSRLLQIIPTLDRAGAERQLSLLVNGLDRERFDVHVCALTRGGPHEQTLHDAGIPVTVIGKRHKLDPAAFLKLKRHIAALQPDLVQTWMFAANAYGRVAARQAGVRRLVACEVAANPGKPRHEWIVDRHLAKTTDTIMAGSEAIRDHLVGGGIPAEKIHRIHGGVPRIEQKPDTKVIDAIRRQFNIPPETKLVATVGRLSPEKRIKDAIWASELLKACRDDINLLIIGEGSQRAMLMRYRDGVENQDRAHFLGERDDVDQIIPHLTALWMPSDQEGLPNAVLEAMAAGVPVIATDLPAHRELIVPDETGILIAVGDRAKLAGKTAKLVDEPELAQRLGAAGQQRAREHFSVEAMVQEFAKLYETLLG